MGRDDDERFIDDGRSVDNGWSVDEETTVISDGRHAAQPAAPGEGPVGDAAAGATGAPNGDDVGSGPSDGRDPRAGTDPAEGGIPAAGGGPADDGGDAVGGAGEPYGRPAIEPPVTESDGAQVSLPPGPALVAVGLGLLTKNGWVFQDINLTLRQSSVAAIVGPAGSGRTSLLLALVGRMEANTGSLTIAGHSLQDRPRNIRMVTSVARAGRLTFPEPGLTVSESVAERCLIEDENVLAGRSRFEEACTALRLEVDPSTLVGRLTGEQATLLAVALACVRVSAVIVLDDLDRDVSAATQQRMMDALIRLAKAMGPTIIVTTTDRIPVMEADVVLDLTPMDGAAIWALDPRNAETELISRQLAGYSGSEWAAQLPVVDADPNGPRDGDAAPGDQFSGDQGFGDQGLGDQGLGDQGPGEGRPGQDAPGTDATDGRYGAGADPQPSDDDGRWSRERWEPAGPNSTRSTDRGGDATNAPGPTEDPR